MIINEGRREHKQLGRKLGDWMLQHAPVAKGPFVQGLETKSVGSGPNLAAGLGTKRHHWIVSAGRSLG